MVIITSEIAECVGLWLAEGDNKSIREITFTNNNIELIFFFNKVIGSLYTGHNKQRLYVYSPSNRKLFDLIGDFKINYYHDRRANKTYYIYRLADTNFVKQWHKIVEKTKASKMFYSEVLRGIFAGEGNIKHAPKHHNSRNIRISQIKDEFIEKLLNHFCIKFTYSSKHRDYLITASQLKKLDKIDIANLHPEKEVKFRRMINSVKIDYYSKGFLKSSVFLMLNKFYRTKELADIFKRSDARILDALRELKQEGKAAYIKTNGMIYWAKKELVDRFILDWKKEIILQLDTFKKINDIARVSNVYRKTISRRLRLLEKEGFVRNVNKEWIRTPEGERLVC